MNILNLVNKDEGNVKYKYIKYPDGQQDIIIDNQYLQGKLIIVSRFKSFKDLEVIIAATAALKSIRATEISLYIPYILGARSDRQFVEGGNSYLRDVVAPIINAQGYENVFVLDAHSDVAAAVIHNLVDVSAGVKFVPEAFTNLAEYTTDTILVAPDAGAVKKLYKVAQQLEYTGDILIASKHRDVATGKITHTQVPILPEHHNKSFVIVDDVCDGGRTFIEIAKVIKAEIPTAKLYLMITHGIFSAGFAELTKYFDHIYCTNSYKDVPDVVEDEKTHVTQLNIFSYSYIPIYVQRN